MKATNICYMLPVKLNSNSREYVQRTLSEEIDTKRGALRIEDIIDIQDPNEVFENHYTYNRKEEAMKYIDFINPNYDEGYFLAEAAQKGDYEMLQALIDKRADVNICNESALTAAANSKHKNCIKLLIKAGADPDRLKFTTAYPIVQECLQEMQLEKS